MAQGNFILKGITGQWFKLVADKPSPAFGDAGPKWDFQATAKDKAQADEWKSYGQKIRPVEVDGKLQYRTNFKRPTHKRDGTPLDPVQVVSGSLGKIDPATIGNDSVVNIEIFCYEYEVKNDKPGGKGGVMKGASAMLNKVQVVRLKKFVPKEGPTFDMEEMEVIEDDYEGGSDEPAVDSTLAGPAGEVDDRF